jgi:hypothetical protein
VQFPRGAVAPISRAAMRPKAPALLPECEEFADAPVTLSVGKRKEESMRRSLKYPLVSAAFAIVAGAGIATTAPPAKAQLGFDLYLGAPYYYRPYRPYYAPHYYYAPSCYWDADYGRVCY